MKIQVVFSVSGTEPPEISGNVTWEAGGEKPRQKIVFLAGFKGKEKIWRGPLPKDGEEWECEVIKDTLPENSRKGAILVRLIKKAEQNFSWDCQPGEIREEFDGIRPPKIVKTVFFGLREEKRETESAMKISADWPEEIRVKATEMSAEFSSNLAKFEEEIIWPPSIGINDPDTYRIGDGFDTSVKVTSRGVERQWTKWSRWHGPSQLLSDELKSEGRFEITRLSELRTLCELFGQPEFDGICFDSRREDRDRTERNRVNWKGFFLDLNPAVLFDGRHTIDTTKISKGASKVDVTLLDLDLTVEVGGFESRGESQKWLSRYTNGEWALDSNQFYPPSPTVTPAQFGWAAKKYLSKEQRERLLAMAGKWSLADHTHFFRSAVLADDRGIVRLAESLVRSLRRLLNEKEFSVESLPVKVDCDCGESPDGMRGPQHWTETHYCLHLVWPGGAVRLPETLTVTAAVRWYLELLTKQLQEQLVYLRKAFTAEAKYEELPAYAEPASTVTTEEHQEVSRKIDELLSSSQSVIDATNELLAHDDCLVQLQNKKIEVEQTLPVQVKDELDSERSNALVKTDKEETRKAPSSVPAKPIDDKEVMSLAAHFMSTRTVR